MRPSSLVLALAVLFPAFAAAAPAPAPAEARHADHEALRALRDRVTAALEKRDFDALAPLLAAKFSVVTIDQRRFTSVADLKAAYEAVFGGDHPAVKSATFKPQADELTEFLGPA